MTFFIFAISLNLGTFYTKEIGYAFVISGFYSIDIEENLQTKIIIEYWSKQKNEFMRENNYSSLDLISCLLYRFSKFFFVGGGLGIYFLSNYVKEKIETDAYTVIHYYGLSSSPIGFHLKFLIKITRILIEMNSGIIATKSAEENLFNTYDDVKFMSCFFGFEF